MGFTYDMFIADEEVFQRDLFKYTVKRCDAFILFVRDIDLSATRFERPYIIMHNSSFPLLSEAAVQEDEGVYSINLDEWTDFEKFEEPHISYCRSVDVQYKDVFVVHFSISSGLLCDNENETTEKLRFIMEKYKKRYFSKAGRHKYRVFRLIKNK